MRPTRLAVALVLLAASLASGQWLETTFGVPDSLCGGILNPQDAVYNSANGHVYIGGHGGYEVAVLDGTTGAKVAKIPVGSGVADACCDTAGNKV